MSKVVARIEVSTSGERTIDLNDQLDVSLVTTRPRKIIFTYFLSLFAHSRLIMIFISNKIKKKNQEIIIDKMCQKEKQNKGAKIIFLLQVERGLSISLIS